MICTPHAVARFNYSTILNKLIYVHDIIFYDSEWNICSTSYGGVSR